MEHPGPRRTVLIEGQLLLRELLARAIRTDPRFELLADLPGLPGAEAACRRLRPDLVLLDVDLPEADGIELARRLVRRLPRSRILALSQRRDPVGLNRLHEVGVHGFVEKEQSLDILEEAMLEVGHGRPYFTATLCHTRDRLRADPAAFPKILTGREQDILRHVLEGLTSREIADRLDLSPRSIETFRYRLMRKLEVPNLAALLDFAFRRGLLTPVPAGAGAVPAAKPRVGPGRPDHPRCP